MVPLDYGRSFLIGNGPGNEVRFWVESRTRIIDEETGKCKDYIQAGSCKSENTFAEKNLFNQDNYDFLPVFGPDDGIIFRRKAHLTSEYKSCLPVKEMWNGQKYHLIEGQEIKELTSNRTIRQSTYKFDPIVSQTEIWNQKTKLRAIIECPVKTLNTNRKSNFYQIDTGPIALPDLSKHYPRYVDSIQLAFVAFNVPDFADFVIESPTPVGEDEMIQVLHYSQLLTLPAENRLYAICV